MGGLSKSNNMSEVDLMISEQLSPNKKKKEVLDEV